MFSNRCGDAGDDEGFVPYLSETMQVVVDSGCEERVQAVASAEPTDVATLPRCEWCPDLVEDVRWRMSTGERSAYALWCRHGVAKWGVRSRDNQHFLAHLHDEERAFVELATGRLHSRADD